MHEITFLDFDHTLFDTDRFFHVDVRNAFSCFGINDDIWQQSYDAVWKTGYTIEKQIEEACKLSGKQLPVADMQSIITHAFSNLRAYVFPDVFPALERFKSKGDVFLLSFGDPEWQRYKVTSSGIAPYGKELLFTREEGGKAAVVKKYAQFSPSIIVVDNNPAELDCIRELVPDALTYCMNRVPVGFVPKNVKDFSFLEARKYCAQPMRYVHKKCSTLEEVI